MLLLSDIESCIGLTQELQDRGVRLEAKIGPLALLVSELSVPTAISSGVVAETEEALNNYIPNLVNMMHSTSSSVTRVEDTSLLDASKHDIKLEEFSDLIAKGVMVSAQRAKGVVIPAIARMEDAINERFKTYEDRNIANIAIDEVGLNQILDNEQVYDYFEQYKNLNLVSHENCNFFPAMGEIDIARLIEAGDPEITEHLNTALLQGSTSGSLGLFTYEQLYRGDRFTHDSADIPGFRNIVKTMYGECVGVEALMIAYYIGKGLLVNLPEGVVAGLKDVERRINLITRTLGLMIFSEIEKYRSDLSASVLFPVGLPIVDRTNGNVNAKYNIRVNREVYADFLANGGSPEAIYGTMVSDHCTDKNLIIERRHQYEEAYAKFVTLNRSYTTSSKLDLYVDAIRDEFYEMVADTEELKGFTAATGVFIRLLAGLKRMGADHIKTPEDTYKFLRGLLSYVFYPENPEVEKLISDIDNYCPREGEETLTVAEIAYVALADLVVDWLCDQVTVRKV